MSRSTRSRSLEGLCTFHGLFPSLCLIVFLLLLPWVTTQRQPSPDYLRDGGESGSHGAAGRSRKHDFVVCSQSVAGIVKGDALSGRSLRAQASPHYKGTLIHARGDGVTRAAGSERAAGDAMRRGVPEMPEVQVKRSLARLIFNQFSASLVESSMSSQCCVLVPR